MKKCPNFITLTFCEFGDSTFLAKNDTKKDERKNCPNCWKSNVKTILCQLFNMITLRPL
jgi:hypothetical protein